MDPGPFFYIHITVYFLQALFTFLQTNIFYHTIRLILCLQQTSEIDNLTASWGKVLWLCCVQILRCCWCQSYAQIGAINKLSGAVAKPASINLQKWFLSPTGLIKPWFHAKGNLSLCSSYLPLGVLNWVASTANQAFFWRCCREERELLQGESLASNLLICYYFAYFLYFFLFVSFYRKYKKISSFIVLLVYF
jgi:hypothetical protein